MLSSDDAMHEYGVELCSTSDLVDLDALILAVNHLHYLDQEFDLPNRVKQGGLIVDVKSAFSPSGLKAGIRYWSL
jgi:UDP-N-acetyl-D-galactosamine dehydrogenase